MVVRFVITSILVNNVKKELSNSFKKKVNREI
jgi:hypothetical protein